MKKQILFIVMMLLSMIGRADKYDFEYAGIAYKIIGLEPAELEVVSKDGGYEGAIYIPDIVNFGGKTFTITSIGEYAFKSSKVTDINLPSKLRIIHKDAFLNSSLRNLTLPPELNIIEENAFNGCLIKSLKIPGSVKKLSKYCFRFCLYLEYLEFEEGVISIPKFAFEYCKKLKTIILSSTISTIEAAAFRYTSPKVIVSKRKTSPEISGSDWFSGGLGTHTTYNPFTYSDSDDRPISVLLVPQDAKESYYGIKTQDGKDAWPAEAIEEYIGNLNIEEIGTEICEANNNYIITNSGGINHAQLISVSSPDSMTLIIPQNIYVNNKRYLVNSVRSSYFSQRKDLKDVHTYNYIPNEISDNTFSNLTYLLGCLHVPKGKVNNYKNTKGWNQFASIVELNDIYKLKYIVDEGVYKLQEIEEKSNITPEPEPTKEGYTFSGWSEIPTMMPAHDVIVKGSFNANKYKLVYVVDGEEYKSYEVEFGSAISPEDIPTKEGYKFSGWYGIPKTMPAHDVTVTGTFTAKSYILTYYVDGEKYKSIYKKCGDVIKPIASPTKEGYSFSGWSEIPETMPAYDVTVTGTFSINKYLVTYMYGDEVLASDSVTFGEVIPLPELIEPGTGNLIKWLDVPETMPANNVVIQADMTDYIIGQREVHVLIQAKDGILKIYGVSEGSVISAYDTSGRLLGAYTAVNGTSKITMSSRDKNIIVKIGDKAVKVKIK